MQEGGIITSVKTLGERLKEAREARKMTQTAVAKLAGVSQGTIGNLEKDRGKNPRELLAIARAVGVSPDWLLTGRGGREIMHEFDPPSLGGDPHLAHPMSLRSFTVVPTLKWGVLMNEELPLVFKTALPDNAMAPRAPVGTVVEFTRELEPQPGDGVLLRDRDGNLYCREYRVLRAGVWEAHAENRAFNPLDPEVEGLTIVAVLTAAATRWSVR